MISRVFGPKKGGRVSANEIDDILITVAGDMFAAGFDTKDIAVRMVVPESIALRAVGMARERRIIEVFW